MIEKQQKVEVDVDIDHLVNMNCRCMLLLGYAVACLRKIPDLSKESEFLIKSVGNINDFSKPLDFP